MIMTMTQIDFDSAIDEYNKKNVLPKIMGYTTLPEIRESSVGNQSCVSMGHWGQIELYDVFCTNPVDSSLEDMDFFDVRHYLPDDIVKENDRLAIADACGEEDNRYIDLLKMTTDSTRGAFLKYMRQRFLSVTIHQPEEVEVLITVYTRHTIVLEEGEKREDVTKRIADIYLHGAGEDGHSNKEDIGGDSVIEIIS